MKNLVSAFADRFRRDRRERFRLAAVLTALAVIVAGLVFWQLHDTGVAMANEVICGMEEHVHGDDCFEEIRTGDAAGDERFRDEACTVSVLVCGIPEHTHTAECLTDGTADAEEISEYGDCALPEDLSGSRAGSGPGGRILSAGQRNARTVNDITPLEHTGVEGGDGDGDIVITDVTVTDAVYDPTGDLYTSHFDISFTIESDDLEWDEETGQYDELELFLPEGVTVPENYQQGQYPGTAVNSAGESTTGFWFHFSFDEDAGVWKAVLIFEPGFYDAGVERCEIYFDVELDASLFDEDGSAHLDFGEDLTVDVPVQEDQQSTSGGDVKAEKSSVSGWDEATNSITYTIVVSSEKGTGTGITLEDILDLGGFTLDGSKGVVLESVTPAGDAADTGWSALTYEETGTDGAYRISMTLPAIGENGGSYTVTYTVWLEALPDDYTGTATANNGVVVTSEDRWGHEITDDDQGPAIHVDRSWTPVSKRGSLNSDNTIHWTITVNSGGRNADIAGMELTDDAFADLSESDFTVRKSDGSAAVPGTDYEFIYSGGKIAGIRFLPTDDTDGDRVPDSNTNTYTVEYDHEELNPPAFGWTDTEENEAVFGDYEATGTVGDTGGSLSKSHTQSAANADGTVNTGWHITVSVPKEGVLADTAIEDYLGRWDQDFMDFEKSEYTDQWFTAEQILAAFRDSGLDSGVSFTDENGQTVSVIFADGSTASGLTYGADYGIRVYDWTELRWADLGEVDPSSDHHYTAWEITFRKGFTLSGDGSFEMNFTSTRQATSSDPFFNVVRSGDLRASAQDIQGETVTKTDGSGNAGTSAVTIDDSGNLTWIVRVLIGEGYDGAYVVADTLPAGTTLADMTWKGGNNGGGSVFTRNEDGSYTANTYYRLGYTRPDGTVVATDGSAALSAYVRVYDGNGNPVDDSVAYSVDGDLANPGYYQVVEFHIPQEEVDRLADGGNYDRHITLTYTVNLSREDMEKLKEWYVTGSVESASYTNTVEVTYNGAHFGDATQTEDVTYGKESDRIVNKTMEYVSGENDQGQTVGTRALECAVLLNPGGEDLLTGSDILEFWDTLTLVDRSDDGVYITLDPASVRFCAVTGLTPTADVDSDGYGTYWYTDANGNRVEVTFSPDSTDIYVAGETGNVYLIGADLGIDWVYGTGTYEGQGDWDPDGTTYTISAYVPDETAILVRYTYNFAWRASSREDTLVHVKNEAHLKGDRDEDDSKSGDEDLGDTSIGGSVLKTNAITIRKVDAGSYGELLAGATFELYIWDSAVTGQDGTAGAWVDTQIRFTSNSQNSVVITEEELGEFYGTNTAYVLVETEAPEGYVLDHSFVCFYWSDPRSTDSSYPSGFTGGGSPYYATDLRNYAYEYFWRNNPAPDEQVSVQKLWKYLDGSGNEADEPNISDLWAEVQLYYYLSNITPEGWTGDLPAPGDAGGSGYATVQVLVGNGAEAAYRIVPCDEDVTITIRYTGETDTYYSPVSNGYTLTIGGVLSDIRPAVVTNQNGQILSLTYTLPAGSFPGNSTIVLSNSDQYGTESIDFSITSEKPAAGEGGGSEPGPGAGEEVILRYGPYVDAGGHTYVMTLDRSNDWKAAVGGLPEYWFDEDGTLWWYYYYFQETGASEGWSADHAAYSPGNPTFTENGDGTYSLTGGAGVDGVGSDTGTVTVTNLSTDRPSYELPSSGGPGTLAMTAAGLAAAGGAACAGIIVNRRRKEGDTG